MADEDLETLYELILALKMRELFEEPSTYEDEIDDERE